jgi:hypothetical protein
LTLNRWRRKRKKEKNLRLRYFFNEDSTLTKREFKLPKKGRSVRKRRRYRKKFIKFANGPRRLTLKFKARTFRRMEDLSKKHRFYSFKISS